MKIKFNFKNWYKNGSFVILYKYDLYHMWNTLMLKLYRNYSKK